MTRDVFQNSRGACHGRICCSLKFEIERSTVPPGNHFAEFKRILFCTLETVKTWLVLQPHNSYRQEMVATPSAAQAAQAAETDKRKKTQLQTGEKVKTSHVCA